MILVVGSTGQLGSAVVRKLAERKQPVRALMRSAKSGQDAMVAGVDRAFADLTDAAAVERACAGATAVIATANAVVPRRGDTFARCEDVGYRNLFAAAKRCGVRQFIMASVPPTPFDDAFPTGRYKRLNEERLRGNGIPFTIARSSLIMDDWFVLIGSESALSGAEHVTLRRPFWFSRAFVRAVGGMIERRGRALIPGSGQTRHAFITNDDLAEVLVRAVDHPSAHDATLEIGGPQALSWDEVTSAYASALDRRVRPIHLPAASFRLQGHVLRPLSEAASNLMWLNALAGSVDTAYDGAAIERSFGLKLTTVSQFIEARIAAWRTSTRHGRTASRHEPVARS